MIRAIDWKCPIIDWHSADDQTRRNIMERSQLLLEQVEPDVRTWIEAVKVSGDAALVEYVRKFDDADFAASELRVTEQEISAAYDEIDPELLKAIKQQIAISRRFHRELRSKLCMEWSAELLPGVVTGFRREAISAVGLYVPAGKAPLPTVAQILTVAAAAAEVPRIVVTFPPTGRHAAIIVAAKEAGAHEIYRIGGIAAIAALALGTETIEPVNKIAGPGNPYVQVAKLLLANKVGIDMFSGPSEAVIMVDQTASPAFIAADMLARCEHGPDSAAVVVTTSAELASKVSDELQIQAPTLPRSNYIRAALSRYSAIVIVANEEEMISFVNQYAPEHLEIQMAEPRRIFEKVKNAGSTFIGHYAPVAVGDYASGTNHCLPTGYAVKYSSPVSPETFIKTLQFQELSAEGLEKLAPIVSRISRVEGLAAHERSVAIRIERN